MTLREGLRQRLGPQRAGACKAAGQLRGVVVRAREAPGVAAGAPLRGPAGGVHQAEALEGQRQPPRGRRLRGTEAGDRVG